MSITEKQRQQQAELHKKLWSIANDLRGNMDASEFRNYILGLIFYCFLSEKAEQEYADALSGEDITYQEAWADEEYREDLKVELIDQVGYFIEPQDLFSAMIHEIETQDFDIEHLATAIRKVETSTLGEESENDFIGLFSDMDLSSTRLGNNVKERTALISKVMVNLDDLPFVHSDMEIDMLGDAYEFLIGRFAATAGKKAGEFYTPQQVSKILAKIVTDGKDKLRHVYDPTCILVFKKCRQQDDNVLFIDASNDFEKGKNQNHLSDAQVERIIDTYKRKKTIDKYSYSATLQEIADNDYNLNIPRYVDTFEEEAPIDLDQVQQDLKNIDKEIAEIEQEINAYLKELGVLKDE
ncbi:TPA: SAM-dependent DNA methyltransferase [Staphylococcus aureus]|nr:SAM-dependent DNA methyltransferase [Staphylococcus aureus]HCU8247959.1 SAM-dependent DNA methyltransferase [Staphylococcus aureus]HCU8319169.1 SAM-dependent DNA methyltransferase [Staphylococcus aureus]HCU9117505.1 SAM-dependent DNA methyltransferase [Staphylococcus aureus]HCU9334232.1 SAM-dependent DNA methyltransferase [Staphylococcus aureus]